MRQVLIDWLVDVHAKFRLNSETLFLAVYIMDKFMEKQRVSKNKLQLVGVTALFIASKYEEIYPPELKDFVYITDNAYSKVEVIQMEFHILSIMSFNLSIPTCNRFLERYLLLIGAENYQPVLYLSKFLIELSLILGCCSTLSHLLLQLHSARV